MSPEASSLHPGVRVGKFEIVRLIGTGGMGAVYEAIHPELKKRVAIKTLHPELALKPEAQQRFLREGEAASRIRHPHVVDITDVGMHEGMPFLVMEYLEGQDLKRVIVTQGKMKVADAIDLLLPVIAAVAAGHDEGVIHRDLKPHNIFMSRDRLGNVNAKVLDFGVSKLLDTPGGISLTGTAAVMGTIAYMSPEQAKGAKFVDGRTDQYALGLILYECITGKRAHQGENTLAVLRAIGDGRIDPPRVYLPDVPQAFEQMLMRSVKLDPNDRYPTLYELGVALLEFAGERARSVWRPVFERPPARPSSAVVIVEDAKERARKKAEEAATSAAKPAAPAGTVSPPTVAIKPAPGPRASTTLGNSAVEVGAPGAAKPKNALWPIFAAVGGLAALVVVVLATRQREAPPAPAPAAAPTVAVPVAPPTAAPAPAPAPTFDVAVTVTPVDAKIELDGAPAGTGRIERALPADGRSHSLRVSAEGYEAQMITFGETSPPPAMIVLRKAEPAATSRKRGKAPKEQKAVETPAAPGAPKTKLGANDSPIIKE